MGGDNLKAERPFWVKASLWGVPTREAAVAVCWLCFLLTGASAVYGFWYSRAFLGTLFGLAGLAYGLSIRWVDRNDGWPPESRVKRLRGWAVVALLALFAVLLAAGIVFVGYYQIPQDGMYPGLPAGSRLFTLRHPYRDPGDVERGDIIVFSRTEDGQEYSYIFRVVGLPGDTIQTRGEDVIVNGKKLPREMVRTDGDKVIYRETNGGAVYEVAYGAKPPAIVPPQVTLELAPDNFFVLGDNRHYAFDSRFFGPVPFESIIAKKW
jgi:signal peptidase I